MSSKPIKSILFLLTMLIQLVITGNQAFAQNCEPEVEQAFPLYAGQHMEIGTVSVAVDGGNLVVNLQYNW